MTQQGGVPPSLNEKVQFITVKLKYLSESWGTLLKTKVKMREYVYYADDYKIQEGGEIL